jgi:transcription antitermination factor NusG
MDGWFVLYTRQHAEKRVVAELEAVKIPAYVPLERRLVRHSGMTKPSERAIIPGYVFVHLLDSVDYHTARTTDGVTDFLRRGDKPARATEAEGFSILAIHLAQELGWFDHTPRQGRAFSSGQAVRVIRGQFMEWIGTFNEVRNAKEAEVSVRAPGSKASYPMLVPIDMLEAA